MAIYGNSEIALHGTYVNERQASFPFPNYRWTT
jgi:hypothetical protein